MWFQARNYVLGVHIREEPKCCQFEIIYYISSLFVIFVVIFFKYKNISFRLKNTYFIAKTYLICVCSAYVLSCNTINIIIIFFFGNVLVFHFKFDEGNNHGLNMSFFSINGDTQTSSDTRGLNLDLKMLNLSYTFQIKRLRNDNSTIHVIPPYVSPILTI